MNIFLFRTRKNTQGTKSLFQNGYFKIFLLTLWSASDLSSAKVGPTLNHSTHLTSRPGPRNLALSPDYHFLWKGVQIIVGINLTSLTQIWLFLVSLFVLHRRKKTKSFFMLLTIPSPTHTRTESGTSRTQWKNLRGQKSSNMEQPGGTNTVVARVWSMRVFHRFVIVIFV